MKLLIQRVKCASVKVEGKLISEIGKGFLIFIGIKEGDSEKDLDWFAKKTAFMRIFEDENGKMNKSIIDVEGEILLVSQFTLYADCKKGNRPSFVKAAPPEMANDLYEAFAKKLKEYNIPVKTGIFGADMKVNLLNDGPVTIILEKDE